MQSKSQYSGLYYFYCICNPLWVPVRKLLLLLCKRIGQIQERDQWILARPSRMEQVARWGEGVGEGQKTGHGSILPFP